METLHGSLGSTFLQGINDPLLEDTPVVEGLNPEEVHQREKFFDLVLTVAEISNAVKPSSIEDLHGSTGKAPAVVALEFKASFRTLSQLILNRVRFV